MPRRGTTLIEVLMAIFIMALGLVALLTLFPLGAVQMARAVQDERAAQLAANSAAQFRVYWKTLCEEAATMTRAGDMMYTYDPAMPGAVNANLLPTVRLWFPYAMDDPNAGLLANTINMDPPGGMSMAMFPPPAVGSPNWAMATRQLSLEMSHQTRPSYPVMVDPVGWQAGGGQTQARAVWMGSDVPSGETGAARHAIPRRSLCEDTWKASHVSGVGSPPLRTWRVMGTSPTGATLQARPQALRAFTLLDDTGFDLNGGAKVGERLTQYSAAWLLRRDQNNHRGCVNLTVVVYFNRPIGSPSDEPTFMASPVLDGSGALSNTVTFNYAAAGRPALRRGGWVLDATMDGVRPQGFFYRVTDVGVEKPGPNGLAVDVQLETALRPGPTSPKSRMFVVPGQVFEVFDKGPIDLESPTRMN